MKRMLAVFTVLVILLGIVACGEATQPADSGSTEETSAATGQQTPDTDEKENTDENVDVPYDGKTYSFIHDSHHAYKAVTLSDTAIKVEQWYRSRTDVFADPFTYQQDVTVINTEDSSFGFVWLDADRTAFSVTMADENNSKWEEAKTVAFALNEVFPESIAAKADRVYTCLNDKWDMYVAVEIADNVVRIENWYTSKAGETGDPHMYSYDVLTVNTEDTASDFAWLDDAHSAFEITIADAENSRLEEATKLTFAYDAAFEVPDPDPSTRMGSLAWPESGIATLIPAPESDVGKVNDDMENAYNVYVAHITEEQFNAYADSCAAAGFTEKTIRDEKYFWAYNEAGDHVEITYLPYNVMQVGIYAAN